MAGDDLFYAAVVIGTLLGAAALRAVPLPHRAAASSAFGTLLLCAGCREQLVYPLVGVGLTFLVLRTWPREWHGAGCFLAAFGWLLTLRTFYQIRGPTNAVNLMLTLKMVAVGFGSQEGGAEAAASAREVLLYFSCHHGLLTGPHFSVREWRDALVARGPVLLPPAEVRRRAARALLGTVLCAAVWVGTARWLPFAYVRSEAFAALPAAARYGYFFVSSFSYRYRFYTPWLLTEAAGLLLGFEAPANVALSGTELCAKPSDFIAAWNTSVQRWLKAHVYRRVPLRSRAGRALATLVASAVWHGVRPGYYLFFFGVFLMTLVERLCAAAAAASPSLGALGRARWWPLVGYAWTMSAFTFFGAAFNALSLDDTRAAWAAVDHAGWWLLALPLPPCALALALGRRAREKDA